jgi:hypothetical protein
MRPETFGVNLGIMHESFLHDLRARRAEIHARWEALLRTERVNTPLANPDALVHLIDWTLDQILAGLRHTGAKRRHEARPVAAEPRPECLCGRNPLLAFFVAGEQALLETLVLLQASASKLDPAERDDELAELYRVIRGISRREIESFCAVCQHRHDHHAHHAVTATHHT